MAPPELPSQLQLLPSQAALSRHLGRPRAATATVAFADPRDVRVCAALASLIGEMVDKDVDHEPWLLTMPQGIVRQCLGGTSDRSI